jgi:predicted amidohydrolase
VLPECALSAYAFESADDAFAAADTIPGESSEALSRACAATGCAAVCGLLEREEDRLYNTAVVVGPDGLVGRHRKAHVVRLAADRFVSLGDRLEVFSAVGVRIGVLICYEVRFPETARVLALRGANILALPTNWPRGAEVNPGIMVPARAAENNLYVLAANRTGSEGSLSFIGRSAIRGPDGSVLAQAGSEEAVLYAEIRPETAGLRTVDVATSRYTVNLRGDRRPDLYGPLVLAPERKNQE